MTKLKKFIAYSLSFLFFVSCSFDNKTGIWTGDQDEKKRISELRKKQKDKLEVIKIYSSEDVFAKEISTNAQVSLSKARKNSSWKMTGYNLQNFIGNIYLSGTDNNFLKKKIGKNKFSLSKIMTSPLIFDDEIIFSDDKGTIYNISRTGKLNWKKKNELKIQKNRLKERLMLIKKNN